MMRRGVRWLAAGLAAGLALGPAAGCRAPAGPAPDPLVLARQLEAAGFSGRAVIVFGGGHVGGVSYNLTGAAGFIEVTLRPRGPEVAP